MLTNLLPVIGAKLRTFPLAYNWAGPTSLKGQLSTVPLTDNCVMTPVFQDGSLPLHDNEWTARGADSKQANII